MAYFWIAVGSALGGVLRHWCSGVAAQLIGATFPWGTLVVNIAGSFAIGFFFTYTGPDGRLLVDSTTRQFVMVGLCGGYTTFSSFSLQTLNLMRDGQVLHAGANILFSVLLCLLAVWLGHMVAAEINQHHSLSHAASESRHVALEAPDRDDTPGRPRRPQH
jgi:CrcB protein